MTAQEIACHQAFTGGDLKYYNAAGCSQSAENSALIAKAKSSVDTKTILLIGGGVVATGLLAYFTLRK
jgi:hypothetical protein